MFNAQTVIESMGLHSGQEIPLPYGLSIAVSDVHGADGMCATQNQVKAIYGMLGVCQGVMLTVLEVGIPLLNIILVVNEELGVIACARASTLTEMAANRLGLSGTQELVDLAVSEIVEYISSEVPSIQVQYMTIEEMTILWYRIVNSGLVHVLRRNYQSTNYSLANNLESLLG